MNFSLLCPTRNRPDNILNLNTTLYNTVSNQNNIELLFKIDNDDETHFYGSWINIKKFKDIKSDYLNRDYYNFLAKESEGKYVWAIADDIRFLTKSWDKILEEKIEEYLKDKSDRIAYISVNEKGSKAKHPCFPLITREAFNVLGMYFHPQLMSWGADRCLWEVYSGVNRVLHIPEVEIEHLSYHDGKASFDDTAKSMRERFFRDPQCHNKVSEIIVPQNIKQLEKYINGMVRKK